MTEQLKKDSFGWTDAAEEGRGGFSSPKVSNDNCTVLALPDFSQPFVVEKDASVYGLGTVLMQNLQPMAYFSHVLTPQARLKSIYERELMAIVLAIQKWQPYLLARRFIVRSNQRILKYLLEQHLVSTEHQKWLSKLLGYEFKIQFRLGVANKAADALSRVTTVPSLTVLTIHQPLDLTKLHQQVLKDSRLAHIIAAIQQGTCSFPGFTFEQDLLLYKGRLVLPKDSHFITTLLQEFMTVQLVDIQVCYGPISAWQLIGIGSE